MLGAKDGVGWPLARDRTVALAIALAVGLFFAGSRTWAVWTLDEAGLSTLAGKPPTFDFTNLWMGGKLAVSGAVETVFSPGLYREAMRAMFGPAMLDAEWSYPPGILLVGAPLSLLPLGAAYAVWTVGGVAALTLACRAGGLPPRLCALVAVSPAVVLNAGFGQNGAWSAALLIGGLLASERRPMLAGLLFGLLTMKPHLGLLVPVCLIAAGRWRAFGWAAAFSALVNLGAAALFGWEAWRLFFSETRPLMQAILEAPWGAFGYQANAATTFMLARALGADVAPAYAAQGLVAVVAAVAAWRLWRAPEADSLLRASATALLALLATPYAWSYDMTSLSVAVVALAFRDRAVSAAPLGVAFAWPALVNRVSQWVLPLSPLVLAFMACACFRAALRAPPEPSAGEAAAARAQPVALAT